MIVNVSIKEYDAKRQGASFDQQEKSVQVTAEKLTREYGSNVGNTYAEVESNFLHSLYESPEYASLSPQQFKDTMVRAFYHDPSCPQSI